MICDQKKCFIFNLDGTVYRGDTPITGTIDFIRKNWRKIDCYFLTNNTSKGLESYLKKLNGLGILATMDHLLSPTAPLVNYLRATNITQAYLVGNKDYYAALSETMPELILTNPAGDHMDHLLDNLLYSQTSVYESQAVILAYDTELTYKKLCVSSHLLQNTQVHFFATHADIVCPNPDGPVPDVGSFIALYEKTTGRVPQKIFGKPQPDVLNPILIKYPPENMVVVGDSLATDKKLAENAGIDFILVLSGETTLLDAKKVTPQPWKVVRDLGVFL